MTYATDLLQLDPIVVPVSSGTVRAFEGGEGEPVVLLHGLGGGAANWVEVVPGLAAGQRVIALDLPGHGGSSALPPGAGVEGYADRVAEAIDALGAAPAIVAGHSFGGQVALELASRRPALVLALLLVVSSGVVPLPRRTVAFAELTTALRPGARIAPLGYRLAGRARFRKLVFEPWLVSDAAALSPRATRGFFAELREHRDVRGAFRAAVRRASADALDVSCPALVVWGANDAVVPPDHGVVLARRLGAQLRLVPDCGHLVIGERPDAVVDAVASMRAWITRGCRPR